MKKFQKNHSKRFLSLMGFTLVEAMVVVALFAVIGVSLVSSFFMGMKVWKRASSPRYAQRKLVLGLERLSTELRRVYNYPLIGFTGEKTAVSFANIVQDTIYNISYNYSSGNKSLYRTNMTMQEINNTNESFESNKTTPRLIIPGVENFNFTYYGFNITGGDYDYFDSWNYSASGIPLGVKVSISLENGSVIEKIIPIPAAQ